MGNHGNWRGLYLIAGLAAALLVVDGLAPLSLRGHALLTAGIAVFAIVLAFWWTETHADLVESSGVDAWADGNDLYQARLVTGGATFVLPQPEAQEPHVAGANSADLWYTRRVNNLKV